MCGLRQHTGDFASEADKSGRGCFASDGSQEASGNCPMVIPSIPLGPDVREVGLGGEWNGMGRDRGLAVGLRSTSIRGHSSTPMAVLSAVGNQLIFFIMAADVIK